MSWLICAIRRVSLRRALPLALLAATGALPAQAAAGDTLSVCLNRNNPPFSARQGEQGSGFDWRVAQAVAQRLGKTLEVRWYDKERRSRVPVSAKTSALISAGVCQLVGGYPLIASSLAVSGPAVTTTLPPIDGLDAEQRNRSYESRALVAGAPYLFAGITVVLAPGVNAEGLQSLDDVAALRIGNRPSSIGDLIVMAYRQGALINSAAHIDARDEPFDALLRGEFDLTFTEMHSFDRYRATHPDTPLRTAALMLPVGFNLGFVTTDEHAGLLEAVNAALHTLAQDGALHHAARDAGLTYLAPQPPAVRAGLGLENLTK